MQDVHCSLAQARTSKWDLMEYMGHVTRGAMVGVERGPIWVFSCNAIGIFRVFKIPEKSSTFLWVIFTVTKVLSHLG